MPGVRNADRVLIGAFVLMAPSLTQAFGGNLPVAELFVRFALALGVCWAFGAVIERLIDSYSRQARQNELARRMQQLAAARHAAANPDNGAGTIQ